MRKSLPAVLGLAFMVVLAAAAAVGWDMTARYEALFLAAKTDQTQRLLDSAIAAKLWREQFALAAAVAQNIANNEQIRDAVAARDTAGISSLLKDEFRRGAVSSGRLHVTGITVYDSVLLPLGDSWESGREYVPESVTTLVTTRSGIDRLAAGQIAWLSHGAPRLTVFAPMGLRPAGYVGLHIDPLPALKGIDQTLGMKLQVVGIDGRVIFTGSGVDLSGASRVHTSVLHLNGPAGERLADIEVSEDISALSRELDATRHASVWMFVGIMGGVAIIVGIFVYFFLRKLRRHEQLNDQRSRDKAARAPNWSPENDAIGKGA